jgi:hypothetical protein
MQKLLKIMINICMENNAKYFRRYLWLVCGNSEEGP